MRRLDDEDHPRDPEHSILLYQDAGIKDNDPEAAWLAKSEELTGQSRRKKLTLFWVDKRTLPWRLLPGEDALEKCARAQNRPLWVCDRMAAEIRQVPDSLSFTSRERLTLLKYIDNLSRCIGGAERIHQTVIPLNYARHTLRALTLWLFSLPFALVKDLKMLTGPVLFFVSWLLFGVYEIGYAIGSYLDMMPSISNQVEMITHNFLVVRGSIPGNIALVNSLRYHSKRRAR
jgi:hypothetical protein